MFLHVRNKYPGPDGSFGRSCFRALVWGLWDIGCMPFGDKMDPLLLKLGEMSMTLTRTSVMRLDTQRAEGRSQLPCTSATH